jgi:hypothetical protein
MVQKGLMRHKPASESQGNPNRQTMTLWPEFAAIMGIGRNSAYSGARRGDFRTIRIGKKIVVAKAEVERLLRGTAPSPASREGKA